MPVTFAIASGGGSITGAQQVTDATGRATVGSWSLGPQVGVNTLHASAVGVDMSPAVFTATAFAVVPARLAVHAGQGQSARINTAVPIAPAVIVTNAAGTPAPGQLVTFVAEGGTIADASVVTGADGVASPGAWTLGSTAGSHDLVATAAGLQGSPLRFQAMATPGPPARLVPQVDPGNSVVGMAVSDPPGVYVQDAGENNLSGVQVTFAVTSGSVTGAVKLTDESGHAAPDGWVLGTTAGVQNLTATVAGLPPLTLPIEAVADELASIELAGGNGQTAGVRRMLPLDLVVKYEDRYGNPVRAQDVVLEVPDGGQITDVRASGADGLTRFRWRLGSSVGIQTVTATKPEIPGQSVVFTAGATAVNSQFAIDLRYLGSIAPPHQAAFEAAVARWRDLSLDDVPQWELSLPADFCFDGQPLVDESVDDLVIFVQVQPFDGVGGVLGAAGACVLRSGSHLPVMGVMIFDSADLDDIASHGELPDVVLHEMGHVLGFGTTWQDHGLVFGVNTFNPIFTGTFARAEYESLGGSGAVPVENTGGVGTAYVHWRESVFANELMTGFIGGAPNPLSRLTIGSMRDLGYGVDYGTADGFGGTAHRRERGVRLRQLREKPLERPIVVTQPDGSISGQRPR